MFTNAKDGIIESIENGKVAVQVDGTTLFWEEDAFHDAKVGDTVHLVALKHADLKAERNEIAKTLLNNALHNEEDL